MSPTQSAPPWPSSRRYLPPSHHRPDTGEGGESTGSSNTSWFVSLRIVGGNTGTGVFKGDEGAYDALININNIPELKAESRSPMSLGANVSITDAIHFLARAGQEDPRWTAVSKHLALIASWRMLCSDCSLFVFASFFAFKPSDCLDQNRGCLPTIDLEREAIASNQTSAAKHLLAP